MDLLQELGTVAAAETRKTIAIIPVPAELGDRKVMLGDKEIWKWCVRYAQLENVLPVVLSASKEVNSACLADGLAFIKNQTEDLDIRQVFEAHPSEICVILDPCYPFHVRGMLRQMRILLQQNTFIAGIRTQVGGMEAYDTYIKQRIFETPESAMQVIHVPDICGTRIDTQEVANDWQSQLESREIRILSPWFNPEKIAVILPNVALQTQKQEEAINNCDLIVGLQTSDNKFEKPLRPDVTVVSNGKQPFDSDTLICYFIADLPESIPSSACELPTIAPQQSASAKLKDFSTTLIWHHIVYPEALLVYYGNPNLEETINHDWYNASRRDISKILEKTVWMTINMHPMFVLAGATPQFDQLTGQLGAQAPAAKEEFLEENLFKPPFDNYTRILHVQHPAWSARVLVNVKHLRGGRVDSRDMFTIKDFAPDSYLCVSWDNWGDEIFICEENANVWHRGSEAELKTRKETTPSALLSEEEAQ